MSEVQSRPASTRGRGSYRGGRGGYRGGRSGSKSHKSDDQENIPPSSPEEQGEIGELKRKFVNKISTLKALFPEWSDEDLVFALKEADGDMDSVAERISTGAISQWGEVKKKHSKTKEAPQPATDSGSGTRGGRGRGTFEGRGRGRGTDRGRGASRGARGGVQTNGTTRATDRAAKTAVDGWGEQDTSTGAASGGWDNNESAPGWGDTPVVADAPASSDWANETAKETSAPASTPAPEAIQEPKSSVIPAGKVTGWAGLFAKPAPAPVPKQAPAPAPTTATEEPMPAPLVDDQSTDKDLSPAPAEQPTDEDMSNKAPELPPSDPPLTLTPSKDELTEVNLEQLPDTSNPPATATAASTAASTQDPQSLLGSATPAIRPGMSGYATSALKATSGAGRSASFTRRVMEQQEAVVMPGNHAVDRAAVQFGSMGLNGSAEDLDVDENREEPETRTQLPDDSPVAPRASLPPPPPQAQPTADSGPTPRQAPGLPPAPQEQQEQASPPQTTAYADQFARYGQSGQKTYDPFGQQSTPQQPQSQVQTQEPFSTQAPVQPQQVPSSAPNDYSSFYNANQQRDAAAYQNYYGTYGQSQETQQRSGSAFGTTSQDTQPQYATSRPQAGFVQQEAQHSGHNTPNPSLQGHQAQHSQHVGQNQGSHGGYAYGYPNAYNQQYPQYGGSYMNQMGQQHRYGSHRPMFDDVRRQNDDYYMQQNNQYGYGQQQYGGGPYNKSSMYGQPQHQYSYEHSSSPANAGSFGQNPLASRDGTYGRTGSAQPSEAQQSLGSTAFGGMADPFGRTASGFGGQSQQMSQQHGGQQGGSEDSSKGYEAAKTGGPSPAMAQTNRPGSANMAGQQQMGQTGGFPPPQPQQGGQQAYGGYPQYGGLGNVSGQHQGQSNHHQNTGYGTYGGGAAFGSYGGGYGGRGWNGNYGSGH